MQLAQILVIATVLASEALALTQSSSPAAGGLAVRDNMKRHKKACKAKKPASKGNNGISTGGSASGSGSVSSSGPTKLGNGKKLGLSWTYGNYMNINLFDSKAGWRYNWKATDDTKSDIAFLPMLWNNDGSRTSTWEKEILGNPSSVKSKTVMFLNEPEISGQANMSPQDACKAFNKYILPLKRDHGFQVIGPAIVTLEGDWYPNFVKACPDVQKHIDIDAVHLYDSLAQTSIDRLKTWHSKYNRPIIISESSCHSFYITDKAPQCTGAGMADKFYSGLTKFVAETDYMWGLAPFGVFKSSLPDGVGDFNRLSSTSGQPTGLFKMITSIL